jgi:tetratricopeptide (TPR) repeat protein
MRAKTVKRLTILIAVFMLVGASAFATWKFQVGKMALGVVEQADKALERKDYAEAIALLEQHLAVFPGDQAVQLKYADALLKFQPTLKNQEHAMRIFNEILEREPGRADVRRQAAELSLKMPETMVETARRHLSILLKSATNDGELEFMMGRCYEADKDPENAVKYYREAIEHGTTERFHASLRLAMLIRVDEKLGKPEDADKVMDDLVGAEPSNYKVYLGRGHYRGTFNLGGAEEDLQKSLKLDREQPDIYIEAAALAERSKVLDEAHRALDPHQPFTIPLPTAIDVARQILDNGLEPTRNSVALYQARADLERRAGRVDRFIGTLEQAVAMAPQQIALHLQLALVLAAQGDTGKLSLHIEELRGLGVNRILIDYLGAYLSFNRKEYEKAQKILVSIQSGVAENADLKARVNVLLAKVYGQLHQPALEREANQRAFNANPKDMAARVAWITGTIKHLVNRGQIDEAIKEYRHQLEQVSQLSRLPLVDLMLKRNRQRPPDQRNWREVEDLLEDLMKAGPRTVELVVLRAILYEEQDQPAKALEVLEAARSEFPDAVEPWTTEAEVLMRQKKYEEALGRLDLARKALDGDRTELRLARAAIWVAGGVPKEELAKDLNGLAKDVDAFPKEKRRGLLAYLARELAAHQDVEDAERLWLRLAEDDPEDANPHIQLFEVAFQAAVKAKTGEQARMKAKAVIEEGCDLRLMSAVNDVSGIPSAGKSLIILAGVEHVLYLRIFDGDGKVVMDDDEKKLTEQAREIADLREQLQKLWPPHEPDEGEKARVVSVVTSIVGGTIEAQRKMLAKAELDVATQVKAIEKIDGTSGRSCRARYLTWQATPSMDELDRSKLKLRADEQAASAVEVAKQKLRAEARALLAELKVRRDDWDFIPLTEAMLEEQELAQAGLDQGLRKEKQESLINLYQSAIDLGSRNPEVVRRAVELLFTTGRSNDAIQLYNRMAGATSLSAEFGQKVAQVAIAQNNQQAEETTRKAEAVARAAVAANPGSLKERIWLFQILLAGKRTAEAEAELRSAIAQAEGDPDPWLVLVNLLIQTKQLPAAKQAIRDAEKKLARSPLALAQCCELMGRANAGPNAGAQAKGWYDEARQWFGKARQDSKDLSVARRFAEVLLQRTEFFVAEKQFKEAEAQLKEAEAQLKEVLVQASRAEDAATSSWARRTLAFMYIKYNPQRPAEALALLDAAGARDVGADPDGRRLRAKVLEAQGTPERRREAIECLVSLVEEGRATPEDQLMLARLEEVVGDWPKSRDQYRRLIERIIYNPGDADNRKRQVVYRAEFAERLLRARPDESTGDRDKDFAEAQEQIERLKRLQPDLAESLKLELALYAARKNFEGALALIRSTAERPDLNPSFLPGLAEMAEKIGLYDQFKLAEELYRKFASDPKGSINPNKVRLVQFLARRGRFADALDICEALRKNPSERTYVDNLCLAVFIDPGLIVLPEQNEQFHRLIGWLEEEIPNAQQPLKDRRELGLGNLYERLGQDGKAKESYRAIIANRRDREGVASNNLAWLMALSGERLRDALDLINNAIQLKGENPDFLDTRGVVYVYMNEGDRAIADLEAAVKAKPTASKYFHLAQAYLIKNNKPNARKNLDLGMMTKGLPNELHRLEWPRYEKVREELGMP